ncbi:MAG TPA: hypothetical protein VHB25_18605 [Gemmatimonadaceae bacterium]|nr:hypothetical protein [Gemmatimonadaceae bacterium]
MKRLVLLLAVAVAGSAGVASAQDSASLGAADHETTVRLQQIVDGVRSRGLPVEQIVAKVRYASLVAHAPTPKIVAVAQAVAQRLETARDALAPRATANEIDAGADAIGLGVTVNALRALRAASPNRPVTVPIGVLTQLVASRVPIAKATAIVTNLMRGGANDQQIADLGKDVNQDIALGRKPDAALEIRAQGLIPILAPSTANASTTMLGPTSASGKPKKP